MDRVFLPQQRVVPRRRWRGLTVLMALLLSFAAHCAHAQDGREHDPRSMTRTEVQMVQDALIWTSTYVGLKDGGWGRLTAEAARNWRRANNLRPSETFNEAELTLLFRQAIRARDAVGWTMFQEPHTGVWVGYPARFVEPRERRNPSPEVFATDFKGGDGAIHLTAIRNGSEDVNGVRKLFGIMAGGGGVAAVGYRLDREHRQVISLDLHAGSTVYFRMDRHGAEWRGFLVSVRKGRDDLSRVISAFSAEFSPTGRSVIDDPFDAPVLGPIVNRLMAPAKPPPVAAAPPPPRVVATPAPPPVVTPAPLRTEEPAGSGTAFAVRRDGTFLTNGHVIDGCRRVTLPDGTRLDVIRADQRRDLALLRADLSTPSIVRFRRDQTIDLGEAVSLFGYPLYRAVSTSINLTNGIVTSLVGLGDDPIHFQINAAMQPGNSGGPLLDEAGLAIGVAVARLSDGFVMRATGTVPQTMNYAIRGQVAEAFLLENGVLADKAAPQGRADLREVARQMQAAVTPILCYR